MGRHRKWESPADRLRHYRDRQNAVQGNVRGLHALLEQAAKEGRLLTLDPILLLGDTPGRTLANLLEAVAHGLPARSTAARSTEEA